MSVNTKNKKIVLRFRSVNKDIFDAINHGKKKVETRAATKKYSSIVPGDIVVLICGSKKIEKQIKKVELFPSITSILKRYKPSDINPNTHTEQEARLAWYSFPGYKEKIKKYGLIAMTLSSVK